MWRANLTATGTGQAQVVLGQSEKNAVVVQLEARDKVVQGAILRVSEGATTNLAGFTLPATPGQLALVTQNGHLAVLWNNSQVASLSIKLPSSRFGLATKGAVQLQKPQMQPLEAVVFRDDFMRATSPDEPPVASEWSVKSGDWKTSGEMGARADVSLNPNPFVFRAQSSGAEAVASAGKWFWDDYIVSASVRAATTDTKAPLTAALEAFGTEAGAGVRGEIDFQTGVARIKQGDKVLAQSAPFNSEIGQWHRVRLEPGPSRARLFVDNIERVSAPVELAAGPVSLRARTGPQGHVDFDDVRVGSKASEPLTWGENAGGTINLPERFLKDRLMKNWANAASAWKRDTAGTWWHSGDFFHSLEFETPTPKLETGRGLQLRIFADSKKPESGWTLDIVRPREANAWQVRLLGASAADAVIKEVAVPAQADKLHLWARLAGPKMYLTAAVGTQSLARFAVPLNATRGTELGLMPTQSGQAVPTPPLQTLHITSDTVKQGGHASIGANLTIPMTPDIAQKIGLPDALGAIIDHVQPNSPAQAAGIMEGDVVRKVNGIQVTDIDAMHAAVDQGAAGTETRIDLEIVRPPGDYSGIDWEKTLAASGDVLDYAFTSAPTDWRPARGRWQLAERWTCSPQWSFFAGTNDPAPLMWSRFATQGDWTLEAYVANPMDLARGERSPSDLNVTVGGDGKNLDSGYSFLFAADSRNSNQIRRGNSTVFTQEFQMPPGAGDTHQDWFYIRLERRTIAGAVHFHWSVNGREIADYEDKNPLPDGGRFAFWTQNGAVSLARVRLWHSGLKPAEPPLDMGGPTAPIKHETLGAQRVQFSRDWQWSVRDAAQNPSAFLEVLPAKAPATLKTLKITNPRSGSDWTVYVTRKTFTPAEFSQLEWDYNLPSNVKINLYAQIDGRWREIEFSGGRSSQSGDNSSYLGRIENVQADGQWHHANFDLQAALRQVGLDNSSVQALAFAAPNRDYLLAGLGGNPQGASWQLRDFRAIVLVN